MLTLAGESDTPPLKSGWIMRYWDAYTSSSVTCSNVIFTYCVRCLKTSSFKFRLKRNKEFCRIYLCVCFLMKPSFYASVSLLKLILKFKFWTFLRKTVKCQYAYVIRTAPVLCIETSCHSLLFMQSLCHLWNLTSPLQSYVDCIRRVCWCFSLSQL